MINELYRDAAADGASSGFSLDDEVVRQAMKNIYSKSFHPMTDIEENLFYETWKAMNEATDKGFGIHRPADPDYDFYQALKHNNAVFSAFKVHRAQNDMAAQLLDSGGKLKPFGLWSKEVQPIATHQMEHWLRTEYDTAVLRAQQAADWRQFEREKDMLPNLKWLPSTSIHPGADHKVFWGTVLPVGHPFWKSHRPGDRWNCKCTLTSTDEPRTPMDGIPEGGDDDKPADGLKGNPGQTGELFDKSHPYVRYAYDGAEKAVRKFLTERAELNESILYADPKTGKETDRSGKYYIDPKFGKRLQTSVQADQTEMEENSRAAQAMLNSFPKMKIKIREHTREMNVKNPEYVINGKIADRKGIESEAGITSAFRKAIKQGCRTVVIDLDMHMKEKMLKVRDLARYIDWRKDDFKSGTIQDCYVIYHGRTVKIGKSDKGRDRIQEILKQLEPS